MPVAVEVILETGQASIFMLQRRTGLGYAQCAYIMNDLEELGFVGPFLVSKSLKILITKEQWESYKK